MESKIGKSIFESTAPDQTKGPERREGTKMKRSTKDVTDLAGESSDNAGVTASLGSVTSTVVFEEFNKILEAVKSGRLDVRAELKGTTGDDKKMLEGINEIIEAFVAPINVTAEYVDRISKGDIPEPITDVYKGDFNEIKNNLNQCIDVMKGLLKRNGPSCRWRRLKVNWIPEGTRRNSRAVGANW